MSNKVFEEKGGPHRGHAAGETDLEKQASQLASDTKYKVKQRMGANVSRMSPAAVTKAYLAQLAKSPAPGPVKALAQKKILGKGLKEYYDIDELASTTVANALYKVFVEGVTVTEEETKGSRSEKFLIVVTDKKTGNEYRRTADRAKIAELRANPNIARVEITKHGEPYEKEAKTGEQTAAVKSGKGLAKRDYDGDGKVESGAKEHAGAVHNAIQRNRGGKPDGQDTSSVKEELVGNQKVLDKAPPYGELTSADFKKLRKTKKKVMEAFFEQKKATKDQNETEIVSNEEKGVDNKRIIKVFPEQGSMKESALGAFHELIQERKMTKAEKTKEEKIGKKTKKKALPAMQAEYGDKKGEQIYYAWKRKKAMQENADCDYGTTPKLKKMEEPIDDDRQMKTKVSLVKNKLRSMGLKMSYELEGEQIDEVLGGQSGDGYIGHPRLGIKNPLAKNQTSAKTAPKNTGIAGRLGNRASEMEKMMSQMNSYEAEGQVISEREHDEPGESGPEVERHNAALRRRSGNRETTEQRMKRMAAEQRARGAHRRPRPGTYG